MSDEKIHPEQSEQPEKETEYEVEFTTRAEYIASATNALSAIDGLDPQIMNGANQARIKRIKRKSLKIIDACICEMYDEIFEDDEDE